MTSGRIDIINNTIKHRIAIHGVPRSGTTWLGEILNSSPNVLYKFQPLFSYELKDYLNEKSSASDINSFFEKLEFTHSSFLDQTVSKAKGTSPDFKKDEITHIVYKEVRYHHIINNLLQNDPEIKVIGIIRNPFAVINSWLHAPREFRRDLGWTEAEEWKYASKKNQNKPEEFYGYEKWKEVAFLFQDLQSRFPDRFYLINYAQLLVSTSDVVSKLFEFCNLNLTDQTKNFIKTSKSIDDSDTYSVFKIKENDNQWKDSLNSDIIKDITTDLEKSPLNIYL